MWLTDRLEPDHKTIAEFRKYHGKSIRKVCARSVDLCRGSGVIEYNVQAVVDTKNHLIVTYKVTNTGSDRRQLSTMAKQTQAVLEVESLDVVADRGYFYGPEIFVCEQADITVTLPKPMTSGNRAKGMFVK